jgi:hypothetical protein
MDEFARLAAKLNTLPVVPDARIGYDAFAGGLVWSDERPTMEEIVEKDGVPTFRGLGYYRALINHRTSLIMGEPGGRFRELWAKALEFCPNWPGLQPSRRDPALAEVYKARSEASARSFEQLEARFERQQNATVRTTNA